MSTSEKIEVMELLIQFDEYKIAKCDTSTYNGKLQASNLRKDQSDMKGFIKTLELETEV